MTGVFNWFLTKILSSRLSRLEEQVRTPHDVQHRVFSHLLEQGKKTEWGKLHGYADVRNTEDFRKHVPISSYEALFPWIERVYKGEQGLLWPEEVYMFSKSSGTTNARSKYIPVTEEFLENCHYAAGKDMLALYSDLYPDTQLFKGKGLALGGNLEENPYNPKAICGDVSALIMKYLPFWAEYMRTPGLDVALMPEWEPKIEALARHTMNQNITSFQGVPTWSIFLIRKMLEITGKNSILEVWPNLECFFHGAVSFEPYRELFKQMIPSDQMNYLEVYNASEGFFGLQDQRNSRDLLLLLDYGVYYEFIPMEEWGKENPKTLELSQVELGKSYALVISTSGGLWRYSIGDTITFTSKNPYRIRITGRTKHFLNAFGEEVVVENADRALAEACRKTGASLEDYTAAPIFIKEGKQGGHEWIIEFITPPSDLAKFTYVLDETLRDINSDYDAKRTQNIALVAPKIHAAAPGTFYEWMRSRGKLGGQNKVPRLSNSREYVDGILSQL